MASKKEKKRETRTCPVCGRKFAPKAVNQKYCSVRCKRSAAKKAVAAPSARKNPTSTARVRAASKRPVAAKERPDSLPTIRKAVCVERVVLPKSASAKANLVISLTNLVSALSDFALSV